MTATNQPTRQARRDWLRPVPEHVPPHNLEAEEAVLGAVLAAGRPLAEVGVWCLAGLDFPAEPDGGIFALDYNRHGRKNPGENAPDTKSMNMLFCDGHAEFVSCREAYRAIRFN